MESVSADRLIRPVSERISFPERRFSSLLLRFFVLCSSNGDALLRLAFEVLKRFA